MPRKSRRRIPSRQYRSLLAERLEGRYVLASISGQVIYDVNSSWDLDPGDRPLSGWVVFLDADKNGERNEGEVWTTTDENGKYRFQGLRPGLHTIAEEIPAGWTFIPGMEPSAEYFLNDDTAATQDFGNYLVGQSHHWTFDDGSGSTAAAALGHIPIELFNWDGNEPMWVDGFVGGGLNFNGDNYGITTEVIAVEATFSIAFWSKRNERTGNEQFLISPETQSWISADSRGMGIGQLHAAKEPLTAVWEHYAFVVDRAGNQTKIYRDGVQVTSGKPDLTGMVGKWIFGHLNDTENHEKSWHGVLDDVRVFTNLISQEQIDVLAYRPPQTGIASVLVAPAKDFGVQPDGVYDSRSIKLNLDPAEIQWLAWNEFPDLRAAHHVTNELLLGSRTIGIDDSVHVTVRNPLGDSLKVEIDRNGQLGTPLDVQAVIYGDADVAPNVVRGDNVEEPFYFNESGSHNSVFTVAGQYEFTFDFRNIGDFGRYPDVWLLMGLQPCIRGSVWHDFDGDGRQEDGEPPLNSRQVYIDGNNNEKSDAGERMVFTEPDGSFKLEGNPPGRYIVRQVTPTDWTPTPAGGETGRVVDVGNVGCTRDVNFGSKRNPTGLTPGNILVSKGSLGDTDLIIEYTLDGTAVQAMTLPPLMELPGSLARDVVIDEAGNVQIVNGVEQLSLVSYVPAGHAFTRHDIDKWTIQENAKQSGDIAAFENYLFATNHRPQSPGPGVIRFSNDGLEPVHFALGRFTDLTVGLDGLVYVTADQGSGSVVRAYTPRSMRLIRTINFPEKLYSISVDASGQIYGLAELSLDQYSDTGTLLSSAEIYGRSIDISSDGKSLLIASSDSARIVAVDTWNDVTVFLPYPQSEFAHGAFVRPPGSRNFPPFAANDVYFVDEDQQLGIPLPGVLTNDFDEESEPITTKVVTPPVNGTFELKLDGTFNYEPNADFAGIDRFTYRAYDSVGESETATVSITVRSIQDSPQLIPGTPIRTTNEDTPIQLALSDFINRPSEASSTIRDVDAGDAVGGIGIVHSEGSGVWEYSLNGTSFARVMGVAPKTALLLPATAIVRFTPNGAHGGTAKIVFHGWDASAGEAGKFGDATAIAEGSPFSSATDTLEIVIEDLNDAPELDPGSPLLGTTDEETPFETSPQLFLQNITDADPDAAPSGIAVLAAEGRGRWYYSQDGDEYVEIGDVDATAALLLTNTDMLRYVPDGMDGENATLTYRAWDGSTGLAGKKVNASDEASGGTNPFSLVQDTATLEVTPINDPPLSVSVSEVQVPENTQGAVIGTIQVSDADPNDSHSFDISDDRFEIVEGELRLKANEHLDFEVANEVPLELTVRDLAGDELVQTILILVANVNEPPLDISLLNDTVLENDQGASIGQLTVVDSDGADTHTLLVSDIRFQIINGELQLRPGQSLDAELEPNVNLEITARDAGGLSIQKALAIRVSSVNEPPTRLVLSNDRVAEGSPGALIGELTLDDPDIDDTHSFVVSDERFEVVDGMLKLRSDQSLNFEEVSLISITITVSDSGSPPFETSTQASILVEDVNDPPHEVTISPATVRGNVTGEVIGALLASDEDVGQTHTFVVSDPRLVVVGSQLMLKSGEFFEGDEDTTVEIEVTAIDSGTPPKNRVQTITINVTANPLPWHNADLRYDTDGDGAAVPLDALRVVNLLNNPTILGVGGTLPQAKSPLAFFYDVNGDGFCTPNDVLQIVNFLNRPQGEGEAGMMDVDGINDSVGIIATRNASALMPQASESRWVSTVQDTPMQNFPPVDALPLVNDRSVPLRHHTPDEQELESILDELLAEASNADELLPICE